jgi:hypothetical protein
MKKNMGVIDKAIRIIVAMLFVILYFTNVVTGIFGIVLLIFAAVFVLTSIIGFCPLYWPLKISTDKKQE